MARRFLAVAIAPLIALGWLPPASAVLPSGKVLILAESVTGGATSLEAQAATALGYSVEVATDAQWAAKTAADFASYRALILGDPSCSGSLSSIDAAVNNRTTWGPQVDGNVIVNGTDPEWHVRFGGRPGARQVIDKGIAFAVDAADKTGMYISLSCYYHGVAANTPVPVLEPFGTFGATGVGCFNDAHIVATHPALLGLTDASLSNWSCSVHEAFSSWPSSGPNAFTVLAIARNAPGSTYTAPDGSVGTPYILARGEGLFAGNIALAPTASSGNVGESHTVTATLAANGSPLTGKTVSFSVLSGPHAGGTGTGTSNASGQATFSYTGSAAGIDTIQASFVDDLGTTQSSNVVSREWIRTNTPPTGDAGGAYTGDEGAAISVDGTAADVDPADVLTYSWVQAAGGSFDAGAACSFADANALDTTVTCTDDGTFNVELTVSDGVNPPVTSTATLVVNNVNPTVSSVTSSTVAPVAVNTSVTIDAAFADQGANDTHSCTLSWGDSGSSAGMVSAGACSGNHSYTTAGIYTVDVTAIDDDGGSGTNSYQYVVVYDPAAGFVTGGGWIDSPAGAYAANPTLTGRANFGFVSKYRKGTTVPDGQTQFQFQAAGFNFHSTAYEWLVVSGPKAQYKGSGTINGAGDYAFMLTANDGQVTGGGGTDRLRLKVWDKTSGDVLYDNQSGDANDAAASDAIESGSIVIHKK